MVCCLYVDICFGVAPHHMPDHVVTLAWHTRPYKIRSQNHELTCEACHVHNRRGFGANDGIFLGMDLWSISPLYTTFRFDTCMEHLNICHMHFCIIDFGHNGVICPILPCCEVIFMGQLSKPNRLQVQSRLCQGRARS